MAISIRAEMTLQVYLLQMHICYTMPFYLPLQKDRCWVSMFICHEMLPGHVCCFFLTATLENCLDSIPVNRDADIPISYWG